MLKIIIELAISIWVTSTLFMLAFYFITNSTLKKNGHMLKFTPMAFIICHFCPIIHTKHAISILIKFFQLRKAAD